MVSSREISPELNREQSDEVSLEKWKTVGKSRFSLTRVRGRSVVKGSSAPGKKVKRLLCLPLLGTSSSEHYSLEQTPPLSFLYPFFSYLLFFLKKSPSRRDFEKKQNKTKKKQRGRRAPSTALLIDEMFPLPAQLFRPFSLENSQWHPVRFASWFICHISFISLNSLYLSGGSMHLSWLPQRCLQARSRQHSTCGAAALSPRLCRLHEKLIVWCC